jgi:hypothetical protein
MPHRNALGAGDMGLARDRHKYFVPPLHSVEIRVDFQNPQEELIEGSARIVCRTCERELTADPERRVLECPECAYSLTPVELGHLCDMHIEAIRRTFGPISVRPTVKRGIWWRFTRWLRRERPTRKALPS